MITAAHLTLDELERISYIMGDHRALAIVDRCNAELLSREGQQETDRLRAEVDSLESEVRHLESKLDDLDDDVACLRDALEGIAKSLQQGRALNADAARAAGVLITGFLGDPGRRGAHDALIDGLNALGVAP